MFGIGFLFGFHMERNMINKTQAFNVETGIETLSLLKSRGLIIENILL